MVSLLGYIADGRYKKLDVKSGQSWNEGENLYVGTTVIPQFLASSSDKPESYYVAYPGVPQTPVAATHFVGVAGVGLDAAEYRADDAAKSKLRGIFGYDRETKPADIKDGLDQTILLLQVPPSPRAPWIAGGGSTVRGVSTDNDCVQPFVCVVYEDKPGTFAVMADGKVRFIPASIDSKTFQALCTIAGGEKIKNLDAIAPEVPAPDEATQPELKAAQPAPIAEQRPATKTSADWTEYTSKEGGFSVSLPPGKVQQQDQQAATPAGKLTIQIYGVELASKAGGFITMYSDYPDAVMSAGTDKLLDGAKAGATAFGKGAKITGESKITVEGHPGREWVIDVPGQGVLKGRVFFVKNRFYQLVAGGDPKKVPEKDVQKFFDSFKLTGK
jgi:hypothetical protein